MANATRRDIAPFLQRMRAFLLGREHTSTLRFQDAVAARTQPPPVVPGGPAHCLSANYYYKRNPPREVGRPIDVIKQPRIAAKSGSKEAVKLPTPGRVHQWD